MVETILEHWAAVLAIIGGIAFLFAVVMTGLIIWRRQGGGDIDAGPVKIDVDGKPDEK